MANRKLKIYSYTEEQLYKAYVVNDMSLQELAIALECSESRLRWYLNELGIKKYSAGCKKHIDEMIDLYVNQNIPIKNIAEIYGVNPSTIRKNFKTLGIKSKKNIVSTEDRMKAYADEKFMKEVNDFFKKNLYLFDIYSNLAAKRGYNFSDFKEYAINEFYTYCVTRKRLENFKKYSLRNFMNLKLKHFIYKKAVKEDATLNEKTFNLLEKAK